MAADFPMVDRNRRISIASKVVLDAFSPGNWVIDDIGGQNDFGFDFQVYVDVGGGVQHTFFIQLKGTEKLDLVNDGHPLRTRNDLPLPPEFRVTDQGVFPTFATNDSDQP